MLVAREGRREARATQYSLVSVALLFSASESAAAPSSPILLPSRLQHGEEGQACSWSHREDNTDHRALT
jgi:hypothetical protein